MAEENRFPGLSKQAEDANEFVVTGPIDAEQAETNQDLKEKAKMAFAKRVESTRTLFTKIAVEYKDPTLLMIAEGLNADNLKESKEAISEGSSFEGMGSLIEVLDNLYREQQRANTILENDQMLQSDNVNVMDAIKSFLTDYIEKQDSEDTSLEKNTKDDSKPIVDELEEARKRTKDMLDGFVNSTSAFYEKVSDGVGRITDTLSGDVGDALFGAGFSESLSGLLSIMTVVKGALTSLVSALSLTGVLWLAGIGALVAVIYLFWDEIKEFFNSVKLGDTASDIVSSGENVFREDLSTGERIFAALTFISDLFANFFRTFLNILGKIPFVGRLIGEDAGEKYYEAYQKQNALDQEDIKRTFGFKNNFMGDSSYTEVDGSVGVDSLKGATPAKTLESTESNSSPKENAKKEAMDKAIIDALQNKTSSAPTTVPMPIQTPGTTKDLTTSIGDTSLLAAQHLLEA